MTIEGVNLIQTFNCQRFGVKPTLDVNIFIRQNYLGMPMQISGCLNIIDLEILEFFVFVDLEIKIGLSFDLFV